MEAKSGRLRERRVRLAELMAAEQRAFDVAAGDDPAFAGHPEVLELVQAVRSRVTAHRPALRARLDAIEDETEPQGGPPASRGDVAKRASASLRELAVAAADAAFAGEAAYQVARLAYDVETCDLVEEHIGAWVEIIDRARRAMPRVVARELSTIGAECACQCPACSTGMCGCIRATLAVSANAWLGAEPPAEAGLELLMDPRSGSQLAAAGLREGDRLLSVDGTDVGRNSDVQAALRRHEVGEPATFRFERRGGDRLELIVRRVG